MRQFNKTIIDDSIDAIQDSPTLATGQIVTASFTATFEDATATGTFKLQCSNEPDKASYNMGLSPFEPETWIDVPNQSNNISAGGASVLTLNVNSFAFLRAVFTPSASVQTITPVADVGVKQVQTITAIADTGIKQVQTITVIADTAGSLNSTYFLISSINLTTKAAKNFYIWYSNGSGVDPAVPSRTAVPVVYANNDSANTIGTLTRAALAALTNDFTITGATDQVIATNKAAGASIIASDGTAATGFGFVNTTPGANSNLNNTYFLISSVNLVTKAQKNFYVWFNTDAIGTDPAVAAKTAVPVAITSGSSNATVGGAIRTALTLANDFTPTGSNQTAIITNKACGLVTAIADGAAPTGFTLANTTPGVNSNLNNKYFTISSQGDPTVNYAVWFNIDAIGTAPVITGSPTLLAITLSSGATAATVGTGIASALDATTDFAASGTTTVTVTNSTTGGTFIPAANGSGGNSPGFSYAITTGGTGNIAVNCNMMGV